MSMYFSCPFKLLFWPFVHEKNFDEIVDPKNNGKKSDTLCASSEIREDPGLISTMSPMTNNPMILLISPTLVRVTEMKMQLSNKPDSRSDRWAWRSTHEHGEMQLLVQSLFQEEIFPSRRIRSVRRRNISLSRHSLSQHDTCGDGRLNDNDLIPSGFLPKCSNVDPFGVRRLKSDSLCKCWTKIWRTCCSSEFGLMFVQTRWRDHLRISNCSDEPLKWIMNKAHEWTIFIGQSLDANQVTMSKSPSRPKENSPSQKKSRALRRTRCPRSMDVFILSDRPRMRKISPKSTTTLFSTIVQRISRIANWLCWRRRSSSSVAGLSMFLVERFSFVVSRCVDVRISSLVVSVNLVRILSNDFPLSTRRCRTSHSSVDTRRFASEFLDQMSGATMSPSEEWTVHLEHLQWQWTQTRRRRRRMKSNDSNCSIELPVDVNRYDEWLMKLKRSLLGKWIDGVEKNLLSNLKRTRWMAFYASLQFFFGQTIEFASSKINKDCFDDLWRRFSIPMQFLCSSFEVPRMRFIGCFFFLRLFTVLLSLIFQRSTRSTWSVSSLIFLRSSPNNLLRLHLRPCRLVCQLKKVFASRSDVTNADRSSSFATNGVSQTTNEAILDAYLGLKREISSIEIFCPSICKRFDVWLRHHRASIPSKRSLHSEDHEARATLCVLNL